MLLLQQIVSTLCVLALALTVPSFVNGAPSQSTATDQQNPSNNGDSPQRHEEILDDNEQNLPIIDSSDLNMENNIAEQFYDQMQLQRLTRSNSNGKPTFIRFGKRAPSFIRFGKRASPAFIRFGKRASPSFIRFGRSAPKQSENM